MISGLQEYLSIPNVELMIQKADALDAALCVLAAKDFIEGKACQPSDHELAHKEGWIWVRTKEGGL